MSSQDNNINLLEQLSFYGKTIKPRVKKFYEKILKNYFMTVLILQEKKEHLKSMPKPIKWKWLTMKG